MLVQHRQNPLEEKYTTSNILTLISERILNAKNNSVAYRLVAKQRLCKQQPLLGNGSVNMLPLLGSRFLIMQQLVRNKKRTVSVPKCYK
jgi:hypothetical protein